MVMYDTLYKSVPTYRNSRNGNTDVSVKTQRRVGNTIFNSIYSV